MSENQGQMLKVKNLTFQGRGPYSFMINGGECVGLAGASGAGKTLLLRALTDLDPRGGQISLGAFDVETMEAPAWRKKVAMLPAESYWWHDRVADHFADFLQVDENLLSSIGFDYRVGEWQVSRLSTGEKQRLAIVRLLANQPGCLLLDEPTASLDPANVDRVEVLLKSYCTVQQIPMLWVSHDPEQLERLAGRRLFMEHSGRLILQGGLAYGCQAAVNL